MADGSKQAGPQWNTWIHQRIRIVALYWSQYSAPSYCDGESVTCALNRNRSFAPLGYVTTGAEVILVFTKIELPAVCQMFRKVRLSAALGGGGAACSAAAGAPSQADVSVSLTVR